MSNAPPCGTRGRTLMWGWRLLPIFSNFSGICMINRFRSQMHSTQMLCSTRHSRNGGVRCVPCELKECKWRICLTIVNLARFILFSCASIMRYSTRDPKTQHGHIPTSRTTLAGFLWIKFAGSVNQTRIQSHSQTDSHWWGIRPFTFHFPFVCTNHPSTRQEYFLWLLTCGYWNTLFEISIPIVLLTRKSSAWGLEVLEWFKLPMWILRWFT